MTNANHLPPALTTIEALRAGDLITQHDDTIDFPQDYDFDVAEWVEVATNPIYVQDRVRVHVLYTNGTETYLYGNIGDTAIVRQRA